jgi:hypothetical protein
MADAELIELITPCGLYCGVCPLYKARTDEALRGKIAGAMGIPVESVFLCPGCRPLKGECPQAGGDPVCETYACAERKGVRYCYECADFPCLKLAPCADRARELPHNAKVYHLLLLEKMGADAFLEQYPVLTKQYLSGKKPRPGGEVQ